jgi:hypothetical protein
MDRIGYQGLAVTEYAGDELKQDQEGIDKESKQGGVSAGLGRRCCRFSHR